MWTNGDSLPGQIESFTRETLDWSSPLFSRSLPIDTKGLQSIVFPVLEGSSKTTEPFRVDTVGGDTLLGNLMALDANTLTLHSARHDRVALKRNQLVSIRRLAGSSLIVPGGMDGWRPLDEEIAIHHWNSTTQGHIQSTRSRSEIFRNVEVPELAELEIELAWDQIPGFVLRFTDKDGNLSAGGFGIETWDDELVILKGKRFKPVTRLSRQPDSLHLRIYVNRRSGEVTVCTFDGRKLADISGEPDMKEGARGLYLKNKRQNLALKTLRIAQWKKQIPKPVPPGGSRLHMSDGGLVYGQIQTLDATRRMLVIAGENDQLDNVPVDKIDTVYFHASRKAAPTEQVQVSFLDGSLLHGTLRELTASMAGVQSAAANKPITCRLKGCREIRFPSNMQKPPKAIYSQLYPLIEKKEFIKATELLRKWAAQFPNDHTTHYDLACVHALQGQTEEAFRLLEKAIILGFRDTNHMRNDKDLESLRENPRFKKALEASKKPLPPLPGDVLHWKDGSIHGEITAALNDDFPIGWKAVGANKAVPLRKTANARIVRQDVQESVVVGDYPNVLFLTNQTAIPCRVLGYDGKDARVEAPFNLEPVQVAKNLIKAIEFNRPASVTGFVDPAWRFGGKQSSWFFEDNLATFNKPGRLSHPTALRGSYIRFTLGWNTGTYCQLKLRLFAEDVEVSSSQDIEYDIYCSTSSVSMKAANNMRRHSVRLDYKNRKRHEAHFAINCTNDQIEISINDENPFTQDIKGDRPGTGVAFVISQNFTSRMKGGIAISNFSSRMRGDQAIIRLNRDIREKVLTVPRLRKSNPPQHVVAAPNGDLLRGELISLDKDSTRFRSKLRDISIPRERVAGIVWLQNNQEDPDEPVNVRLILGESRILAFDPVSMKESVLHGDSPVFGKCQIPLGNVREIHLGNFVPQNQVVPYSDWKLQEAGKPETYQAGPE